MLKKNKRDNDFEKKLNNIIDNAVEWFRDLFSGNKSSDEIINIFLTILVMFVLLWFLKVPFILLGALGRNLIVFAFSPLDNILVGMWEMVIQVTYLVFAFFIVVTIVKKIFSNSDHKITKNKKKVIDDEKNIVYNLNINTSIKKMFKILTATFMIPFVMFNIILFIILGILIGLWAEGVVLIGIIFITIGIFLIMAAIMGAILRILSEGE